MDHIKTLQTLIADYLCQVERLLKDAKPGDGLLGMGKSPQHAPCHDAFDQQVNAYLTSVAAQNLSSAEAASLADLLLFCEKEYAAPPCARWMLIAIHRHGLQLIPFLSAQAAHNLHGRYSKAYPRIHQLPIQRALIKAMRQRMKTPAD